MSHKQLTLPKFENLGSLITFEDDERTFCLGYLMYFEGRGVYDPTYGRVDVSPEDAETHNRFLDKGLVEGLDDHCEVGQGNIFYVSYTNVGWKIRTFIGTTISKHVRVRLEPEGMCFVFERNGRTFRGRREYDDDGEAVFFKRIE